ncbi:MAG: 1-aminocyclopropane-1-carboxylate deaminase/D-cysteine desulfhydrase [Saprospiraceae bacterium]
MIKNTTPIGQLHHSILDKKNIQLWFKRDDLTHPELQGNKWRKLKYNIAEAQQTQKKYLLTFGGAYSNHLFATAAAGKLFNLKTIGIVRGEKIFPLNSTLSFAEDCGMQLYFVDRKTYALKEKLLSDLDIPLDECYVLPEGGTNKLAIKGCSELGLEILAQLDFIPNFICTSCGTGGTIAGLIQSKKQDTHVLGFSALKGDFMKQEVQNILTNFFPNENHNNFSIQTDYHFGGYAKHSSALLDFINSFKQEYQIQLDPIYTGKMLYGIFDLIEKDFFPHGSRVVAIHTGGLQGILGFRERFGNLI